MANSQMDILEQWRKKFNNRMQQIREENKTGNLGSGSLNSDVKSDFKKADKSGGFKDKVDVIYSGLSLKGAGSLNNRQISDILTDPTGNMTTRATAITKALRPQVLPEVLSIRNENIAKAEKVRSERQNLLMEKAEIDKLEKATTDQMASMAKSGVSRAKILDYQEQKEKELKHLFERRSEIETQLLNTSLDEFADIPYRQDFDKVVNKSYDKFIKGYFHAFPAGQEKTLRYLLMTDKDAADRFYKAALKDEIPKAAQKSPLLKPVVNMGGSLDRMARNFGQMFTDTPIKEGALEGAARAVRENTDGVAGVLLDVQSVATDMLPTILTAAAAGSVSGGAGTAAVIAKNLPMAIAGVQSGAGTARSMLQQGYTPKEAWAKGTLTGVTEAVANKLFSGVSLLQGKFTGKLNEKVAKAFKSAAERVLKSPKVASALSAGAKLTTNMAGEGLEEWFTEGLDPVFQNIVTGEDNDINFFSQDGAYAFLLGALTSGLIEAPSMAVGASRAARLKKLENRAVKSESVTYNVVANALESGDKQVALLGQQLKQKLDSGKRVSVGDIKEVINAYLKVYEQTGSEQKEYILRDIANKYGSQNAGVISIILDEAQRFYFDDGFDKARFKSAMQQLATDKAVSDVFYDITGLKISDSTTDRDVINAAFELKDALNSGAAVSAYNAAQRARGVADSLENVMLKHGVSERFAKNAGEGILSLLGGGSINKEQAAAIRVSNYAMRAFNTITGSNMGVHAPLDELISIADATKNDALRFKLKGLSGQTAHIMQDFSQKTGLDIRIDKNEKSMRGTFDPVDKAITFSPATSEKAIIKTLALQRLTSQLQSDSVAWRQIKDFVLKSKYETKDKIEAAISQKVKAYKKFGAKLTRDQAADMIVNGYIQYELPDIRQAELLSQKDNQLAANIYMSFKSIINDIEKRFRLDVQTMAELEGILQEYGDAYKTSDQLRQQINQSGIKVASRFDSYPPGKQRQIIDYIMATDSEITDMFNALRQNKDTKSKQHLVTKVPGRLADDIRELLGIDVSEYNSYISTDEVRHIEKRHGINGKADNSMANADDPARVGWILENYDDIRQLKGADGSDITNNKYKDNKGKPAKLVLLTKKINGTYYSAITAAQNKNKALHIISTYISNTKKEALQKGIIDIKKEGDTQQVLQMAQMPPSVTSETLLASLSPDKFSIAQQKNDVNRVDLKTELQAENNHSTVKSRAVTDEHMMHMQALGRQGNSVDRYKQLMNVHKRLDREFRNIYSKVNLSANDIGIVKSLAQGTKTVEDVTNHADNLADILKVYDVQKRLLEAKKAKDEFRKQKRQQMEQQADKLLRYGDFSNTSDAKAGVSYALNTMQRNTESTFKNYQQANEINRQLFDRVKTSNARRIKKVNQWVNRINSMNISQKKLKGDMHTEAFVTQFYGEAQDYINRIKENPQLKTLGGQTLDKWQADLDLLWEKNPGLYAKKDKINKNLTEIRSIYNELFELINESEVRYGRLPIEYRRNYFPHFVFEDTNLNGQSKEIDRLLITPASENIIFSAIKNIPNKASKLLSRNKLPTEIAGQTEYFTPYARFFAYEKSRHSNFTDYDVLEGFKRYIEPASKKIYFADDIEALRAFENRIRYWSSDDGIKERYDKLVSDIEIPEHDLQKQIDELFTNQSTQLGNYTRQLRDYTNRLAGKTSVLTRGQEFLANRAIVDMVSWLKRRVGANMVGANVSSALTNFIPLTQASGVVSKKYLLKGMADTLFNLKKNDGLVENSDFLANRKGTDLINPTMYQKMLKLTGAVFENIDMFTAESIVRARYMQNIDRGLDSVEALRDADLTAARIMVDRSTGSLPALFDNQNILLNTMLQFQVENINQFQFLLHDIPREHKGQAAFKIAQSVLKVFVSTWAFNELYEAIVGRRPGFDPIDMFNDLVGDVSGYKLPNTYDALTDLLAGREVNFKAQKLEAAQTAKNLGENIVQQVPVINTLFGGGRFPVFEAFPESTADIGRSLAYVLPPVGGGQLMKTLDGISAIKNKGVYSKTKSGDKLRYPIYTDTTVEKITAALQNVLFGKNSSGEARNWVENDFKSYGVRETQLYNNLVDSGANSRNSIDIIDDLKAGESKEQKYTLIKNSGLDESQKKQLYLFTMDSNAVNQKVNLNRASNVNIPIDTYMDFILFLDNTSADKDVNGKSISGSKKVKVATRINNMGITNSQKDMLYRIAGYSDITNTPWHNNNLLPITDELFKVLYQKSRKK